MLTIAYLTNRKDPKIEWFFGSLARECGGVFDGIRVVVVDFFAEERAIKSPMPIIHVPPKPTVWQGKHRLTTQDYFAASNARNTAICLAPDGHIAYCDDLSVLMPGWLAAVRHATTVQGVVAGAYKKVLFLEVENGVATVYREHLSGNDSRWNYGNDTGPVRINGGALFGCSLVAPIEALLAINGWDEDCDSMGMEDCICGLMMERQGWPIYYDRRMLTLESEELHSVEKPFMRIIKKTPLPDASWAMLNMVLKGGRHAAPNYFGPGGLRAVRARMLAGEPFPVTQCPLNDWRDGQLLSEM